MKTDRNTKGNHQYPPFFLRRHSGDFCDDFPANIISKDENNMKNNHRSCQLYLAPTCSPIYSAVRTPVSCPETCRSARQTWNFRWILKNQSPDSLKRRESTFQAPIMRRGFNLNHWMHLLVKNLLHGFSRYVFYIRFSPFFRLTLYLNHDNASVQ